MEKNPLKLTIMIGDKYIKEVFYGSLVCRN
jgi:hypothetical protein